MILLAASLLAQAPPPFDALAAQAAQARDSDRTEDAIKLYRRALQLRPSWAEGWWYLGTLDYDTAHYSDAAAALNRETLLVPKDANGFAMLGLSEARLNQNQSALAHLQQALTLGVGDQANLRQVVLFTQANLLLDQGAFGQAQSILDTLAQQGRADEELVVALGRSVLGISSSAAAAQQSDLILAAGRAEILAANRQTKPAMAAYADLVARFPAVHNVEFARGRFLLDNHLDDQAVAAFKREIENSPQHLLARLGIAGTLLATDPATSRVYAEQAVQLAPALEEAHYLLGASLLATGMSGRAASELERAASLNARDSRVYFELAKVYKRLHRETDAAQAREKFLQLNPQSQ